MWLSWAMYWYYHDNESHNNQYRQISLGCFYSRFTWISPFCTRLVLFQYYRNTVILILTIIVMVKSKYCTRLVVILLWNSLHLPPGSFASRSEQNTLRQVNLTASMVWRHTYSSGYGWHNLWLHQLERTAQHGSNLLLSVELHRTSLILASQYNEDGVGMFLETGIPWHIPITSLPHPLLARNGSVCS